MRKFFCMICLCAVLPYASYGQSPGPMQGFPRLEDLGNIIDGSKKLVKGLTGIGIKEEMAIGGSVAVEIVSRFGGLVRDDKIMNRVNLIGKSVGIYSDRPELEYKFGVLNSSEVNAVSAPGGYIFITKGLFDAVDNDDQLAGVLAHEIVHVAKRHALNSIAVSEGFAGALQLASEVDEIGNNVDQYDDCISKMSDTLLNKGLASSKEYEADEYGVHLAYCTGYSKTGLLTFLEKVRQTHKEKRKLFSTHPPLSKRCSKLEKI